MLTIKNLTKTFDKRTLFQNTQVTFEKGKVYALIGSSGSGKTTLLNILAKLEPCAKQSVFYHNQPLETIKTYTYFRHHIGYLFQNFGLLDNQSIADNLDLGLIGQKMSKQEKNKRQKAALATVGLDYLDLNQKIFALSGGEAQRVALAKIILKDPPIILADEPTAALDPKTSQDIMQLLLSLKNDQRTIIIATHNPIIWNLADEVISISDIANV
ncbi:MULTISPECIES: putative bacteriocin export ABC transporter [unclassified Granulicatella]|uniref:putative bacteriocin export ABC transporter n=1 Tax=unclassified Granulicatella TaxID=2630493 RepID=UPI001073FA21|nr:MULTISPECIES: putative bacteriocin export ABC transporter [unclassified Granulicatella]MBF0780349.1 ABC transporter ATP-binding protein [Granulicatella sp. 19428wC4_WM01]TFU95528.1 ABC transporter ATP-binding protein [Granulicatella sp. WM01]